MVLLIVLLAVAVSSAFGQQANVTACEWFTGIDPGVGLANPISIGTANDTVSLAFSVATNSFLPGAVARIKVRCHADSVRSNASGVWGPVTTAFAVVDVPAGMIRLVTQFEYQIDNGTWTLVNPADAATISINEIVATAGLGFGLHQLRIRVYDDATRTGVVTNGYFFIIDPSSPGVTRLVTQFEYSVDNGSWTAVNPADAPTISINQIVSTAGLGFGLHQLRIRLSDDAGRTGAVTNGYFFIIDPTNPGVARLVTTFAYRIDDGAWTVVDPADAAQVNINEVVSTTGLSFGLHKLFLRVNDDAGRAGAATNGYFFILDPIHPSELRLVTQIQYWFNAQTPTTLDVTDAPSVNFNQIVATATLPIGLNRFNIRVIDDLGRTGVATNASLVVIAPFGAGSPRYISAAEFFVNVDPGPGNGVPIHLPDDGTYDEGTEVVDTVLTNLPIGFHRLGFRTRDDLGRWSPPEIDSLLVGPILVIRRTGSNIVLNWQSGPGVNQFKIYRAPTVNGTYALVDSTTGVTYTDLGIVDAQTKQFYRVTFETTGLSPFRMPSVPPLRE
jgi:hypothetical protein